MNEFLVMGELCEKFDMGRHWVKLVESLGNSRRADKCGDKTYFYIKCYLAS